jgi:hypothetical protein
MDITGRVLISCKRRLRWKGHVTVDINVNGFDNVQKETEMGSSC